MQLNNQFILANFPHVFKNEFNERKILSTFEDKPWGGSVMVEYVCSPRASFHRNCYGNRGHEIYTNECNRLKALSRTMVLTEDKDGNVELFQFWLGDNSEKCYTEIQMNTKLPKDFWESRNVLKKYYV